MTKKGNKKIKEDGETIFVVLEFFGSVGNMKTECIQEVISQIAASEQYKDVEINIAGIERGQIGILSMEPPKNSPQDMPNNAWRNR